MIDVLRRRRNDHGTAAGPVFWILDILGARAVAIEPSLPPVSSAIADIHFLTSFDGSGGPDGHIPSTGVLAHPRIPAGTERCVGYETSHGPVVDVSPGCMTGIRSVQDHVAVNAE